MSSQYILGKKRALYRVLKLITSGVKSFGNKHNLWFHLVYCRFYLGALK